MPEVKTKKTIAPQQRVLATERQIFSDCFKFELSKMKRNVSWTEEPEYVDVEHCHFFHTVDSDGKVQTYTTATGGHFHEVEMIPAENPGELPTILCKSGPLKWAQKKVAGKYKKVLVPADKYGTDNHKHEVNWVHSSKCKVRTISEDAAKFIMKVSKKPEAPEGVTEQE
jgi:hypothetical protein